MSSDVGQANLLAIESDGDKLEKMPRCSLLSKHRSKPDNLQVRGSWGLGEDILGGKDHMGRVLNQNQQR